jgi:prepilin-type N-terminal cleavage/methylation domain-containing protein
MPKRNRGFTLMEVMAAVMLIAIAMTTLMDLRTRSVGRAADGRSMSVAARLSSQLLHRIESAQMLDLFDGMSGDFSEEGFSDFTYVVALGDGSNYAENTQIDSDSPEWAWRDSLRKREDDRIEEDGNDQRPEKTRIVIRVSYLAFDMEPKEFRLEAMVDSWAVYRDFELYRDLWGSNNEKADKIQ